MSITKKLFLSLIGLTSIILIITLLLARWSFQQGFFDFVAALEQQRLERISQRVLEIYRYNNQDWSNIDRQDLERLLELHSDNQQRRRPPPRRRPPLNNMRDNIERTQARIPRQMLDGDNLITAIYLPNGELLAGPEKINDNNIKYKEHSLDIEFRGQTIAIISSWNTQEFGSTMGGRFSQQQFFTSLWIGLACLILAIVLSFYWSKTLLAPLRKVILGINKISSGVYDVNIKHHRKDEFGKLMSDVNYLATTLDKARTSKSKWFADISHELRTPLSILSGEIEAIKLKIRPFNEQRLHSLEQETKILNRLVDDLYQLSISDLGALRYDFVLFNLSELVEQQCEAFSSKFKQDNLSLKSKIEPDIRLKGDQARLSQLLSNLLVNSQKYTHANGMCLVTLCKQNERIVLKVEDSEPGVSEDAIEALFEPLFREEKSRNRAKGGAGLGLSICKNIVQAHKAHIDVEHSHLGGICVTVIF